MTSRLEDEMFLGRLFALSGAMASSATPMFAQVLRDAGWSPWQVAGARSAIGCMLLAVWLRGDLRLVARDPRGALTMMVVMFLGMTAYVYSAMHASMGTAVSVLWLSVAWVTLWRRWNGQAEGFDIPATVMVVAGVVLAVGFGGPEDTWQGIAAAVLAGFMNASFTVIGSDVTWRIPPAVVACVGMFLGAVVFGWTVPSAPWTSGEVIGSAFGIGAVCGAAMIVLSMYAFRRIGVEARMWFPLDILFVWMAQVAWQEAMPTVANLLGIVFILGGALLLAWGKPRPFS